MKNHGKVRYRTFQLRSPDRQGCALVLKDVAALAALRQSFPAAVTKAHELHLVVAEVPVPEMMDPTMQSNALKKVRAVNKEYW